MPKTPKEITPEAMLLRLATLCAKSEQCETDLRTKIRRAGIQGIEEEKIIERLKADKYLDNARFARAFANDKAKFSGWGKLKIRQALYNKKISTADISSALDQIPQKDYLSALKRAGIAKAKSLDLSIPEDAAKLTRHLLSKGYENNLVLKLLTHLRTID